ncbi:uncharacterized protein LOC128723984 [Anopheles nili]|uniref:uncharacterized protein LOC128723984 n=1 Tax=Anopheles nili TaxID=185578 RepID=UPI00237A6FDC|nr:uncharacterized protein LOC128723984 [Anopheles nili]
MASLRSFMIRMQYIDRSSPIPPKRRRERRHSSAASTSTNIFADTNNNALLQPVVNPSRRRRKVPAFIYETQPFKTGNGNQSSQLASVQRFDGLDVKLRSEQPLLVSAERFFTIVQAVCATNSSENYSVSAVYCVPRMVPISNVSTAFLHYDTETKSETIRYCTTIEFRRQYCPVAKQMISAEQWNPEDSEPASFVSYACYNVSAN